jgi:hypothetical protein
MKTQFGQEWKAETITVMCHTSAGNVKGRSRGLVGAQKAAKSMAKMPLWCRTTPGQEEKQQKEEMNEKTYDRKFFYRYWFVL